MNELFSPAAFSSHACTGPFLILQIRGRGELHIEVSNTAHICISYRHSEFPKDWQNVDHEEN